jgi:hypothetical protein
MELILRQANDVHKNLRSSPLGEDRSGNRPLSRALALGEVPKGERPLSEIVAGSRPRAARSARNLSRGAFILAFSMGFQLACLMHFSQSFNAETN